MKINHKIFCGFIFLYYICNIIIKTIKKMKDLPSYEKIVELVNSIVSQENSPLMDFIQFEEFIGGAKLSDATKEIIDRLFEEGYPVGFAAMSPESFCFRVYKIGAKTPSAFQLITGKAIKK